MFGKTGKYGRRDPNRTESAGSIAMDAGDGTEDGSGEDGMEVKEENNVRICRSLYL